MTPATYRAGAVGQTLTVVVSDSPLGQVLVARTDKGICSIRLGDDAAALRAELMAEFPNAEIVDEPDGDAIVRDVVDTVVRGTSIPDLHLDVRGTVFQRRVWEELRRIPRGETRTYAEVAEAVGRPRPSAPSPTPAPRIQAALVIPCHRVVRTDGGLGGYRWGVEPQAGPSSPPRRHNEHDPPPPFPLSPSERGRG
jgi:AraC family transcriptional regulator of adaptative response/methylated-DNA-[protein]-cysteine methyltransferase